LRARFPMKAPQIVAAALVLGMANASQAQPALARDGAAVPSEVEAPQLLIFVAAEYSAAAFAARRADSVRLKLSIDQEGHVTEAEVIGSASPELDAAVRDAALRFLFEPAKRRGRAVASRILYEYELALPSEPAPVAPPSKPVAAVQELPTAAPPPTATPPVEVHVQGTTQAKQLRESSLSLKVIETRQARKRTTDTGDVLSRTEGIAVQRSGGLGSATRLSLHGLTDEQVRVFLDGVPLELSGFGLGVANVPLDWVERIDVYRGVVPSVFGADALGGAVDLVTEGGQRGSFVGASYSVGSFGTHRFSASARTFDDRSGFVARAAAFYDTSRNDYSVDVRVPDERGRLHPVTVRRFHDGYRAGGALVEAGVVERPWAKRLLLRVFATQFDKELQHNVDMTVPYGAVNYGQATAGGTLRYEKPNVAGSPIGVALLLGYAHRSLPFRDTSRWVYDWFGRKVFERRPGSGEITAFARDLVQSEHHLMGRGTVTYDIAPGHQMRLVLAPQLTTRTGDERLRLNPNRIDPLTTRREIFQFVTGLEHQANDAKDVLENVAFVRYYLYRPATDQVVTFDNSIQHVDDTVQRYGGGDAFRVRLTSFLVGKLSYEYATRLPRADEVFGDGALVLPNLELIPEASHNGNAGLLLHRRLGRSFGVIYGEATGFFRLTEGMVVKMLAQDRVHAIHQNLFSVRTLGVDGSLGWQSPRRWLVLEGNATFQDQRNASSRGPFAPFAGERVPNRPWLFANASATVRIPGVGITRSALSLSVATHYVHEFLPGWEGTTSATDTDRIPSQLTHSAGAVYSVYGAWPIDLAIDVSNFTDERVYDVLGVQRPGRAAFFKVTLGRDFAESAAGETESISK